MRNSTHPRDEGFTLVELAVAALIIAVLLAIAIPTFVSMRGTAHDSSAQSLARNALNTELVILLETGSFTAARADLEAIEPSLIWNQAGNPAGTIRIRMNAGRSHYEVCIYTVSEAGTWFGIYRNEETGTRFGRPDQVRGCSANVVNRFWEEGW